MNGTTYKVSKGWNVTTGVAEGGRAFETWFVMFRGWPLKQAVDWVSRQEQYAPQYLYRIEPETV